MIGNVATVTANGSVIADLPIWLAKRLKSGGASWSMVFWTTPATNIKIPAPRALMVRMRTSASDWLMISSAESFGDSEFGWTPRMRAIEQARDAVQHEGVEPIPNRRFANAQKLGNFPHRLSFPQ